MSNRVQGLRLKSALNVHASKMIKHLGVRLAAGGLHTQFVGTGAFAAWTNNHNPYGPEYDRVVHALIRYPSIPDAAMLTRGEADLFTGYTIHEVGHVVFTDNNPNLRANVNVSLKNKVEQDLLFKLWNGIEDGRQECALIRDGRTPGARTVLKRLLNSLTLKVTDEWSPTALKHAPFAVAMLARSALGIGNGFANTMLNRIPEPKRSLYAELSERIKQLPLDKSGTGEAWKLAKWFYDEWGKRFGLQVAERIVTPQQSEQPEPPKDGGHIDKEFDEDEDDDTLFDDKLDPDAPLPPPSDDPGIPPMGDDEDEEEDEEEGEEGEGEEGEGEADDEDEESEGEGEEGEEGNEKGDEEGKASASGEGDESEAGEKESASTQDDGDGGDPGPSTAAEAGGQLFPEGKDDNAIATEKDVASPEPDLKDLAKGITKRTRDKTELYCYPPANKSDMTQWSNAETNHALHAQGFQQQLLAAGVQKLKAQVQRLLTAPERIGWDGGAFAGRFDRKRSVPAMNGSEAVFKRRWETEGLNTALTIVIDLSGSMNGPEIVLAVQTAYAIADAAEKSGCPVEVLGFSSSYGKGMTGAATEMASGYTNSTYSGGYGLVVAKGWHHKLATRAGHFTTLKRLANGSTPDYQTVKTAAEQLSTRPEQRKLLMVLTDGCGHVQYMNQLCRASMALMGVEIIGVGIGMVPPKGEKDGQFETSYPLLRTYVPDLKTLGEKSFAVLEKALRASMKGRRTM